MTRPRPDRPFGVSESVDRPAGPCADPVAAALYLPADDGPRRMRAALAVAAAVHALLLLVPLRSTEAEVPEPDRKEYRVVPTPVFKPPEPPPEEPPVERVHRVPIPDPDPTNPEPLRPIESLQPVLDLPPLDPAFDFPEAPPPLPEEPAGPYTIGGRVSAPVRIEAPLPVYPEMARRVRKECTVILRSVIDESGRVTDLEVTKSCPLGMDQAALEAVERWRYEPATLAGVPVPVWMTLRVVFGLE